MAAREAVIAIFGPTGVGKTGIAIELAERLRAEGEDPVAISADALQVYRGLEVLTGAATPEEQERGLMFRRSLRPDEGMIFPYAPPQEVGFWMRNTLIPLDIIYIRPDSTIARIVNAKPLDETSLPSGEPVSLVLEIAGGRAAELGIREGDVAAPRPPCCKP